MSRRAGNDSRSHSCCRVQSSSSSHENYFISFFDQHGQWLKKDGNPNLLIIKKFPPFTSPLQRQIKSMKELLFLYPYASELKSLEACCSSIVHRAVPSDHVHQSKRLRKIQYIYNIIQNKNHSLQQKYFRIEVTDCKSTLPWRLDGHWE